MDQLIIMLAFFAAPIIIIGLLAFGGFRLAEYLHRSLPWTYVTLHVLLMILVLTPYFFGKGIPDIPFDDMYIPFFFYPGYLPTIPGWATGGLLWPGILDYMSNQMGSRICIFYAPGVVNLILGAGVWYGVGMLVNRRRKKTANKRLEATGDPLRGSPAPQP